MKILKNKKIMLIISTIAILSVILTITLILTNNNNSTSKNHNTVNTNDWMEYILNTDIQKITINYCKDNNSNGETTYEKKAINITNEELASIFTEMKKGTITKNYYGGLYSPCMPNISIDYKNKKEEYTLKLEMNRFIDVSNAETNKLLSFLEQTNYTITKMDENMDITKDPYMFEYTYNETIIHALAEKYLQKQ